MARATKWTDEKLKAIKLPPEKREHRTLIAPNLYIYLRRNAAGDTSKQWQYRVQVNGKRRWLSLGTYPSVPLAKANGEMSKLHASQDAAKRGEADHPVLAARHARKTALQQPTVAEAFEEWLKDKQLGTARTKGKPVRQRTLDVLRQNFASDIGPLIGDSKIGKITPEALRRCIDEPRKRGSSGAAAHVYRTLKGLITFAERRDYIEGKNPMSSILNPRPYRPAEQVAAANDSEIVALFRAVALSRLSETVRLAIELQLLTGARPGEVRHLERPDLRKEDCFWVIPAPKAKTGRAHQISLSAPAQRVIQQAKALSSGRFLFASRAATIDEAPMDKMAVARALARLEERMTQLGGRKLRPHDLRRTFRTLASRLGIEPHIAERCLGHVGQDTMQRVYDGHEYSEEMSAAWQRIGEHIEALKTRALDKPNTVGNKEVDIHPS